MDDSEVIQRIKGGDTEAFSLLVEKYHRHLLNFIYRLVRDERIVEDIGQEVFLNVYKSLENYDEKRGTPFSAWLFISARNRCISEIRKRRDIVNISMDDMSEIPDTRTSVEQLLISREQEEMASASLELLPEPYRGAILRNLRGHSLEEIATAEGVSVGTVKSRLCRAREKMRAFLGERSGGKDYGRV